MTLRRLLPVVSVWLFTLLAVGLATAGSPLPNPLPQGEGTGSPLPNPLPQGEGIGRPLPQGEAAGEFRALLPTTLRSACPVVDDFSSPHSGWPEWGYITETFNPYYSIVVTTHDRYIASRGDRWDNSRQLRVTVQEGHAQIGSFGLALAISADESDFITAQIYPDQDLLRLQQYSDGQSTPLGEWFFDVNYPDDTVMTVRGDPTTGQATLTLDDALTIPLPDITGGIGLVVVAGRGRGEAYFDDYVFVDATCAVPD